jgi:hypothetical protein
MKIELLANLIRDRIAPEDRADTGQQRANHLHHVPVVPVMN